MEIKRNEEQEKILLDEMARTFMEKQRGGIHLSDLLYPLSAYWQKTKPLPPTPEEVQYWVVGRGHEDAMHRISGMEHVEDRIWNGIYYGIDFFSKHPIEMKTRRGYLAKEGEEAERYDSYLAQLKGYCACENTTDGELWVWSLLEKVDAFRSAPVFHVYNVKFTPDEIEHEQWRLVETKKLLFAALQGDKEAYMMLPECPDWKCITKRTNMKTKPICVTCHNREFQTDWGLDQHLASRGGKDHEVIRATYDTVIVPKCKYYNDCKGAANG